MSHDRLTIWASPVRKFGEPCISGTRLPAIMIAERYWELGEHLEDEILSAYEITRADVILCCWWLAENGNRRQRQRWREWNREVWRNTREHHGWWSDDFADVPLPPTKRQVETLKTEIAQALDEARRQDAAGR